MADRIFADRRLAELYDPLDPVAADLAVRSVHRLALTPGRDWISVASASTPGIRYQIGIIGVWR